MTESITAMDEDADAPALLPPVTPPAEAACAVVGACRDETDPLVELGFDQPPVMGLATTAAAAATAATAVAPTAVIELSFELLLLLGALLLPVLEG